MRFPNRQKINNSDGKLAVLGAQKITAAVCSEEEKNTLQIRLKNKPYGARLTWGHLAPQPLEVPRTKLPGLIAHEMVSQRHPYAPSDHLRLLAQQLVASDKRAAQLDVREAILRARRGEPAPALGRIRFMPKIFEVGPDGVARETEAEPAPSRKPATFGTGFALGLFGTLAIVAVRWFAGARADDDPRHKRRR